MAAAGGGLVAYVVRDARSAELSAGTAAIRHLPAPFSYAFPVPAGEGYTLTLTAYEDGVTCSGGVGPFSIEADAGANFNVALTCVDNSLPESP